MIYHFAVKIRNNILGMMLSGEYSDFLPEWLTLLAEAKKVVSPKYLPELLTLGKKTESFTGRYLSCFR